LFNPLSLHKTTTCMNSLFKNLFIISIFISSISIAQVDTTTKEPILFICDEMPSFPGGETEMMNFLKKNLKYPEEEREASIMGKCHITFVVEKNGTLTDVKILKGILGGPGCDAEALRVVSLMPKWNPGRQQGKVSRVQVNLPIQFRLRSTDSIAETDTTYFDSNWNRSSKAEAAFYRIVLKHDNGYLVKDMYMKNNLPQMIAVCNALNPEKRNGKTTYYYESGQKQKEGVWIRNKKDGVSINWYESGQKKEEETYMNGMLNGDIQEWFENGQKKQEATYIDETLNGVLHEWYENGQKKRIAYFANGDHNGMRIEWEEDGKDSSVVECFADGTYKNIRISKNNTTIHTQYNVYYRTEIGAEFPGGEKAMLEFIAKTIDRIGYPKAERQAGISGTVYVTFVVEKDGSITDIKLLRGVSNAPGYNKLALEAVSNMPIWKAGMQFGKTVRVQFNLPIRFTLR
jgi:TonB family protein